MRQELLVIALWVLLAGGGASVVFAQETQEPTRDREIAQLRDDLYQVRDGKQYSVFLVTPEGIILGDPLSQSTALWLRDELAKKFPGQSVRFVLYSHHHLERAEGAGVFNDTAEIVGQRQFDSELTASRRTMPKLYRFVRDVETTYDSHLTIMLGGRTVELIHTGWIHSPEMTVLYFPRERAVFAVDPPPVSTVPFSFGSFKPRDVFRWIHSIAPLDFDTLFFGNGESVTRTDVAALGEYLDDLRAAVSTGYEQGQSLAQLQASSVLETYRNQPSYAGRAAQMADVYRTVRLFKAEVSVTGMANYGGRNPSGYCTSYTFCAAGGVVPAGTGSAALLFGRGPGVAFEVTLSAQSWNSRTSPLYDDEVALRQSRGALLFRYSPPQPRRLSYALLGGVSRTVGDARGIDRVKGLLVPVGGRHAIAARDSRTGLTFGLDVARTVRDGLKVIVPIRLTQTKGQLPDYWPSRFSVDAGIGINMRLLRRVD